MKSQSDGNHWDFGDTVEHDIYLIPLPLEDIIEKTFGKKDDTSLTTALLEEWAWRTITAGYMRRN